MALPIFPTFRYAQWAAHKVQQWSTIRSKSTSGGLFTNPMWPNNPLWAWEWQYEVLIDDVKKLSYTGAPYNNTLYTDLQIMEAFYFTAKKNGGYFLYTPPDSVQVGAPLLAVDANNNTEITHLVGAYPDPSLGMVTVSESVQELNNGNVTVKVGGVTISGGSYDVLGPATTPPYEGYVIHFHSTPNGAPITINYNYYYRCNFGEDQQDYEQFALLLWQLQSVKYEQVRVTVN